MQKIKRLNTYTSPIQLIHGEGLSAVRSRRYVYPVDLSDSVSDLSTIVKKLGASKADAIRGAIKYYAGYLRGLEVITYRKISVEQAKREIQKYLKGKDRVSADEISDKLRIDMGLVNETLLKLWQEGWVEPG